MFLFIRRLFAFTSVIAALLIVAVVALYMFLAPNLPDTATLNDTQLQVPLRIFVQSNQI